MKFRAKECKETSVKTLEKVSFRLSFEKADDTELAEIEENWAWAKIQDPVISQSSTAFKQISLKKKTAIRLGEKIFEKMYFVLRLFHLHL